MKFSGPTYFLMVSCVALSTQHVLGGLLQRNSCSSSDWPKRVAATCRSKFDVQKAASALFMDPLDGITTYCRTFAGFYDCVLFNGELCEHENVISHEAHGYMKKIKSEQLDLPLYCRGVDY